MMNQLSDSVNVNEQQCPSGGRLRANSDEFIRNSDSFSALY